MKGFVIVKYCIGKLPVAELHNEAAHAKIAFKKSCYSIIMKELALDAVYSKWKLNKLFDLEFPDAEQTAEQKIKEYTIRFEQRGTWHKSIAVWKESVLLATISMSYKQSRPVQEKADKVEDEADIF